jgi:O-antigen/teichoic acid export membrane protein
LIFVPTCSLLFFAGHSVVNTVLGAKWEALVPALQIMSLTVLMGPLVIVANGLLVATERAHLTSFATGAQFLTQILTMVPMASRWGIVGAAVADLASTVILTVVFLALCQVVTPKVRLEVWSSALLPVVAGATAGIVISGLCADLTAGSVKLVCEAVGLVLAYVGILWLLGGKSRLLELLRLIGDVARRPAALAVSSAESGPARAELRN